jgi:adenylyl-sulfate kinase
VGIERPRGATIWTTGLPAAGKTTLGDALASRLGAGGHRPYRLDGDVLRRGLCADLGFSAADRDENIRRAAHVAQVVALTGSIVVASLISPYQAHRALARRAHEEAGLAFLEVYLATPLAICERRDPKGLYAGARAGLLRGLTGIDDPYEVPLAPDVVVSPGAQSVDACTDAVLEAFAALRCGVTRGRGTTPVTA